MKKTISAIIILLLLLIPVLGGASYLIRLKNGRQLATPFYWFEGRLIFFYTAGGTAGMERTEIDGIEEYATEDHPSAVSGSIEKKDSPLPIPGVEKSLAPGKSPEVKAKGKDSPEKLGEDSAKKRLQEELRTLESESASELDKYRKAQEKLRILVLESDSEWEKHQTSSEQDSISKERDEARNRIFTIDLKKQELIRKLQENNQK